MKINKILISTYLMLLLVLFPKNSRCQSTENNSHKILYGIEISPIGTSKFISSFDITETPNREYFDYKSNYNLSLYGGAFLQVKLNKNLMIESGLNVSLISGKESFKYQDTYEDPFYYTFSFWYYKTNSLIKKLTYLNVPVLLGVNYRKFTFLAGVQLGFNINSKVIIEESIACYGLQKQNCESFNTTLQSNVSNFDIGLSGKINYNINKRWSTGLKFIYEINKNNQAAQMSWNYYSMNALISFKLNKYEKI